MDTNWSRKKCTSCGQGFLCGAELHEGACWCSELPLKMEIPDEQDDASCYCPDCLKKLIEEQDSPNAAEP